MHLLSSLSLRDLVAETDRSPYRKLGNIFSDLNSFRPRFLPVQRQCRTNSGDPCGELAIVSLLRLLRFACDRR